MIEIYTDGSCLKNPGGAIGFGAVILLPKGSVEVYGGMPSGTNQVAELWAAVHAMEWVNEQLPVKTEVHVFSDSKYLVNGMNVWSANWIQTGWKKEIMHKHVWKRLLKLQVDYSVVWKWIKGHNGNKYNVKADRLAGQAAELTGGETWKQIFNRRR